MHTTKNLLNAIASAANTGVGRYRKICLQDSNLEAFMPGVRYTCESTAYFGRNPVWISSSHLKSALTPLNKGNISLDLDGGLLSLTDETATTTKVALVDEHAGAPEIPEPRSDLRHFMSTQEYSRIMSAVKSLVKKEFLFRAYLEVEKGYLRWVMTDSYRFFTSQINTTSREDFQILLPLSGVQMLTKVYTLKNGYVCITYDPNYEVVRFRTDNDQVIDMFVEKSDWDYRTYLPKKIEYGASVFIAPVADLVTVLKRARQIAGKQRGACRPVTLHLHDNPGRLEVRFPIQNTDEHGSAMIPVSIERYADVTCGVDPHFLQDAVEFVDGSHAKIILRGEHEGIEVNGVSNKTMTMPVRI